MGTENRHTWKIILVSVRIPKKDDIDSTFEE